jgi:hypothetical protein
MLTEYYGIPTNKMTPTSIYAIYNETEQTIKIGYSINPYRRLHQIQNGSAHRLKILFSFLGDITTEKILHDQLKEYRLSGEWFSANPEVLKVLETAFLDSLKATLKNTSNFTKEFTLVNFIEEYLEDYFSTYTTKKRSRVFLKDIKKACEEYPDSTQKLLKSIMEDLGYTEHKDTSRAVYYTKP